MCANLDCPWLQLGNVCSQSFHCPVLSLVIVREPLGFTGVLDLRLETFSHLARGHPKPCRVTLTQTEASVLADECHRLMNSL